MEIPRENITLPEMSQSNNYGITTSEAVHIPNLAEKGLYGFFICVHGDARSPDAAFHLSNSGYPSIYLVRGFEEIRKLSEKGKRSFFDLATYVPNLVIMLDEFEQGEYWEEISMIRRKEGRILTCLSTEMYLKNLL